MESLEKIASAIFGMLGGGLILHLYRQWSENRKGDRDYISDHYRKLLESEVIRRTKVEDMVECLKHENVELLTENITLKAKKQ